MPKALGIDLGTTNSVVAVVEVPGEAPTLINIAEGGKLCPSVVGFDKQDGSQTVGLPARRKATINAERTVYSIKRFIGRRFDEVEAERHLVPYKVTNGQSGAAVEIDGKLYTPEEISAAVLRKLKKDAEAYLNETVKDVVITVPAYFNDPQRAATKFAGEMAGFNVLRIITEPTAAAMAYSLNRQDVTRTILVWDLGGGTFDVTVMRIGGSVLEVLATNGDTHLGGDNWDEALLSYLAAEFQREHGIDPRQSAEALQRLREAAETAKIELSNAKQADISLQFLAAVQGHPKHLNTTITRAKFEELTHSLLQKCIKPFEVALRDAGIKKAELEEVVLVGGSTRMPMVQDLIKTLTGREPRKGVDPDEVVAVGAALQADLLSRDPIAAAQAGNEIILIDRTPLSLGVETQGGVMSVMIPRNTRIPCDFTELYTTSADFQSTVQIKVLQGERPLAKDNRMLGNFQLNGIPPAKKNTPQIEVKFEVDNDGILHVSARDLASGKAQTVDIKESTTLSRSEKDRLIAEAKEMEAADELVREAIDLRYRGEKLVGQANGMLQEYRERIEAEIGDEIEAAVRALRSVLGSDDPNTLRPALARLEEAMTRGGDALHRAAAADTGGSNGDGADNTEEEE